MACFYKWENKCRLIGYRIIAENPKEFEPCTFKGQYPYANCPRFVRNTHLDNRTLRRIRFLEK